MFVEGRERFLLLKAAWKNLSMIILPVWGYNVGVGGHGSLLHLVKDLDSVPGGDKRNGVGEGPGKPKIAWENSGALSGSRINTSNHKRGTYTDTQRID